MACPGNTATLRARPPGHSIAVMLATLLASPALAQDGPPNGPWEGHGEERTDEIFYGFAAAGMATGIVVASRTCSDDRRRRIGLGLESAGICRESKHWSRLNGALVGTGVGVLTWWLFRKVKPFESASVGNSSAGDLLTFRIPLGLPRMRTTAPCPDCQRPSS